MRLTLLIILGFFVIAGGTFFWMRQVTLEDVGRQYSQAAEEPLVDTAHLLASLLETPAMGATDDNFWLIVPASEILEDRVGRAGGVRRRHRRGGSEFERAGAAHKARREN